MLDDGVLSPRAMGQSLGLTLSARGYIHDGYMNRIAAATRLALATTLLGSGLSAQEAPPPAPVVPPASTAAAMLPDLAYATLDDKQKLDLFVPERAQAPFATVVFVYGGGWHSGNYKNLAAVGKHLQTRGFGCALVSHRLAPPDVWPTMIEDVAAAVAYVHDHIATHGGDPQRLLLAGHSSGAQLVLLLATDPRWLAPHHLTPKNLTAVLGLSAPVDLRPRAESNPPSFGDTLMAGHGADVFERDAKVMTDASPLQHLSKDLPPTLLVVGERDFPMLLADAQTFASKAAEFGCRVPVLVAKKLGHGAVPSVLIGDEHDLGPSVLAFLLDPPRFVANTKPAVPEADQQAKTDKGK